MQERREFDYKDPAMGPNKLIVENIDGT